MPDQLENVLYCDTRLGGVKRWYIGRPKDADMRIPDDVLDSVCFICVKVPGGHGAEVDFFIGTGFFVSVPSRHPDINYLYLVTARHVLDGARKQGYSEFYFRLNRTDGTSFTAGLSGEWFYSENPAEDVAVIPCAFPAEYNIQYRHMPLSMCITEESAQEDKLGIGDELFMVGLFNHRSGEQRNIPIVRTGIIASMPDEPFEDEEGHSYDAYLMETRSIGGLSGSPVFAYLDPLRPLAGKPQYDLRSLTWEIKLLGVIRGHWDLKRRDTARDSYVDVAENAEIDRLNTGIAQVTPIQGVLEILNGERLKAYRKEGDDLIAQRKQPTLDVELPTKGYEAAGIITPESFEEAL